MIALPNDRIAYTKDDLSVVETTVVESFDLWNDKPADSRPDSNDETRYRVSLMVDGEKLTPDFAGFNDDGTRVPAGTEAARGKWSWPTPVW